MKIKGQKPIIFSSLFVSFFALPFQVEADSNMALHKLKKQLESQAKTEQVLTDIHLKRDSENGHIRSIVKRKNELILHYMNLSRSLENKMKRKNAGWSDQIFTSYEKHNLSNKIEKLNKEIKTLKNSVFEKNNELKLLEKKFVYQNKLFKQTVANLKHKTEELLKKDLSDKERAVATHHLTTLSKHNVGGAAYETNFHQVKKDLKSNTQLVAKISLAYKKLSKKYKAMQEEMVMRKVEIHTLKQGLASKNSSNAEFVRKNEGLTSTIERQQREFNRQKENLKGTIVALKNRQIPAHYQVKEKGRMPASADLDPIAMLIKRKLIDRDINVETQSYSKGFSIILQDDFLFENDRFQLNERAKDNLHKIIQIYATEFLTKPVFKKRILSIDLIGYASPRFRGKAVNLDHENADAYNHNLKVSVQRANEVALYILSPDFSDFPEKKFFQSKVTVSGRSHNHPILSERTPASSSPCGAYDCDKSRRVEIFFRMK